MDNIRNIIKAIIIEDGKILLSKCQYSSNEELCYQFNGGGQEAGDTFIDALKREILEELGAQIDVGKLVWIREYIGKNHEFANSDFNVHQIEYYFMCKLLSPIDFNKATHVDKRQIGVEWVPLTNFKNYVVYPNEIKNAIAINGTIISDLYAGDVN